MGSVYLTWLADELRRAGLRVVECDGWKSRARSSGGFDAGRPWCVMWHHTASSAGTSAANDVAYMLSTSNDAYPTANLYVARDGEVWVMAAGATNTNGKGSGERRTSRGTVPVDSMNTYAVGVEIGNNGVGETYPKACIDAAFAVSTIVTRKLGLQPSDVIHHQAYAPDRKVDPARNTAVTGGWQPRSCTGSGTWSLEDLKNECGRRASAGMEDDVPLTDAEIDKIATKCAEKVWASDISGTKAWNVLHTIKGTVRQFLGGWNNAAPPAETMLKQIHTNTKK